MALGPFAHRPSWLLRRVVGIVVVALAAVVLPVTASAAEPTTLQLSAPAQLADRSTTLTITLTSAGAPVSGALVAVERWDGSAWRAAGGVTTSPDGRGTLALPVARQPVTNRLRASYAGDATHAPTSTTHQLTITPAPTVTTVSGPSRVIDERTVTLVLRRRTTSGTPVPGPILLQERVSRSWRTVRTVVAGAEGSVGVVLRPRTDGRWRAVAPAQAWASASTSGAHHVDNLPPGVAVRLPARAPRPRVRVREAPRAQGAGPNPTVSRIPDRVWRSMTGRSWHRGCPVGRPGLRLLRVNYWDYDGYRRRGEVVAAAGVVHQMAGALADMYDARLPIRSMVRVDRFGWSRRLQGADDYASMAAGNTSAFNCRWVVGRPGVRSPHTWGRALDINTWENPYRSSHGWVPNSWWAGRSHGRIAWRSRQHRVVRIMAAHGLRWTYGRSDSQHFDAVPRGARPLVVPGCVGVVCH